MPPTTAAYFASTRARRSGSAFAAIATINRISGTTALAFTDMPSPRQSADASSRLREHARDRRRDEERDEHVVVAAADDVEHDDRVQPDHGDREDGPLGTDPLAPNAHTTNSVPEAGETPRAPGTRGPWLSTLRSTPVVITETQVNSGP